MNVAERLAGILERQSMLNADMAQALAGLDSLDSQRAKEIEELCEQVKALSNRIEAQHRSLSNRIEHATDVAAGRDAR